MSNKSLSLYVIALVLLSNLLLISSCQCSKDEALKSKPELPFEAGISCTQDSFLPGEAVYYGIGITSSSSATITIDPFPPAMWIKPLGEDKAICSFAAGNRTYDIESDYPDSWYHSKGLWDQKENDGNQVSPGWYEIGYEWVIVEQSTGKRYVTNTTAIFQIVDPDSAMNKDMDIHYSVTAEGMTVTLERIEMNAVEVKVYIFTTPPGYSLPEEGPPYEYASVMGDSLAEYSVDSGTTMQVKSGGGKADTDGITITWDDLEPVPVDAKVFYFTITRLGEVEGRWEFEIPLED